MRAAFLLSPSFITQGRMGARKAALILMKVSHFDRTLRYANFATDELIIQALFPGFRSIFPLLSILWIVPCVEDVDGQLWELEIKTENFFAREYCIKETNFCCSGVCIRPFFATHHKITRNHKPEVSCRTLKTYLLLLHPYLIYDFLNYQTRHTTIRNGRTKVLIV